MLSFDKLLIKCEIFKEIESEMVKLLEVLYRHTARHLFRSSHLTSIIFVYQHGGQLWPFQREISCLSEKKIS